MLDLRKYNSLGEALKDALNRWPDEICLIEADRERENCRLTYRQFGETASPLAAALQRAGLQNGTRAAVIMTNQSKWLISAYALFFCGGVLVPVDYKLTPVEQLKLLAHSKAEFLVTEYHFWRAITEAENFPALRARVVLVTEAPAGADLKGALRWEEFHDTNDAVFVPRGRHEPACIVYSSGTGGRPKGCVLTHENYLEQCVALTSTIPIEPGFRYLSILPTNHAIDFMAGFVASLTCGGAVVHLRTLRPEFIRDAFVRYKITYVTVVPMILKSLERSLRERFQKLPGMQRKFLNAAVGINRALTRSKPNLRLSRMLLPKIHAAFGGELRRVYVGGAFMESSTLQFFYDLGIQVANAYGCTEAGTVITANDLDPFRADTVGKPVPGIELKIANPDAEGIGEVMVRSEMVMSHYLDDADLTAETVVNGWLMTGDLGRVDSSGHLQLFGRKKNMIVTEEGKNIYPEDVENVFEGLPLKEFCVFAANYLWPARTMLGEKLVLVVHLEAGQSVTPDLVTAIERRNNSLLNYKRISGYLVWDRDFPLTASLKLKRGELAEQIRKTAGREAVISL